jgi:hypothetical protein
MLMNNLDPEVAEDACDCRLNDNPMYRSSLEEAEAESWDEPGVEIGAAIEAAHERRKSTARGPARQADEQERGTLR